MARRLKTIAKHINENWDGYNATVTRSFSDTDYTPPGFRYRTHVGKGRHGYKIIVKRNSGKYETIFEHDSSETYRTNQEVEEWIEKFELNMKNKKER